MFTAVGDRGGGARLSRRHIRAADRQVSAARRPQAPGHLQPRLRHTAATLGYLHTGDLRAVQDFLGHVDPRQTSRYAHVVDMAKKNPARFIQAKSRGAAS